jgi:hypothetical protein
MSGNITWSDFQANWTNPLTYQSGTSINDTSVLPASLNSAYANPISINPNDIKAPGILQNNKFGQLYWNKTNSWTHSILTGGAVATISEKTSNGITQIILTANTSKSSTNNVYFYPSTTQVTSFPSNNPAYDYITFSSKLSGPNITGVYAINEIINNPTTGPSKTLWFPTNNTNQEISKGNNSYQYPGDSAFASTSFQTLNQVDGTHLNITGANPTTSLEYQIHMVLPKTTTSETYTETIYALALTNYPVIIGQANKTTPNAIDSKHISLSNLNTNIKNLEIINGGYTANVVQDFNQSNNPSITQASINSGSYIEQVTYQSQGYKLPSAPDLTYGTFTMSQKMNGLLGKQFVVANIGGVSFISQINALNGTQTITYGAVSNPNANTSVILTVDYTAPQWNSVSSAPSFLSLQGLEYYWWVGLIGLMSLIGLGAAASSHFSGDEESLRVPKGKFGR